MADRSRNLTRLALTGVALIALSGCMDADLRGYGALGFDTSGAARQATQNRPAADARGVISYPNYQVAVARQGDTVASIAARLGVDPEELARYNALKPSTSLNRGEVISLPRRVAEPGSTAATTGSGSERIDITSLASGAIDRAAAGQTTPPVASTATATTPSTRATTPAPTTPAPTARPTTAGTQPAASEPIRHRVARGETAYSIARYYNVSAKALAEWNGLPADLSVREGQYLLIPVASAKPPATSAAAVSQPGQGSVTPTPPSAAAPLPAETTPAAAAPVDKSAAPDLGATRTTTASSAHFAMPVSGSILRPYVKGKNDGVDISASPGAPVKAAEAGLVAAITKDTEQVPILVLRHDDGLLTVYANLDGITVQKGQRVTRGQTIAKVRAGTPGFVHFEVRKGYDSVDPMPYLE